MAVLYVCVAAVVAAIIALAVILIQMQNAVFPLATQTPPTQDRNNTTVPLFNVTWLIGATGAIGFVRIH